MTLHQVVATVDEPTAGPSTSVTRLSDALGRAGETVAIHTVRGWRAQPLVQRADLRRYAQNFAGAPGLGALCLSNEMRRALKEAAGHDRIIHTHGLWLMPNVYPGWACRGTACASVISPRGMLGGAALRFSPQKKQVFWRLLQAHAVQNSACLHATGQAEYEEIRAFGINRPVAVIPNGVDLPPLDPRPVGASRTLLALGRIHPKKGLDQLLQAWAMLEGRFPDWSLRIVGPSELGQAETLRALAAELGLRRVALEGPAIGADRTAAYADADLFVLPSLNENFALTVAESLAAGTPVVSTTGAPWSGLRQEACGWWVDVGPQPLAAGLAEAMTLPREVLTAMGERGRAWMARDFSWDSVAARMLEVYRWLGDKTAPPATVRFS